MENKINIAYFKENSRTAEVKEIWQWDYGQILRIQGLNLPTAVEIHFSLDEHGGEAVRRIGITKDGVTDVPIPDSMVENESAYGDSYYFFAYIYLTDETSGNTEYKIRTKVSTRSRPEGYISGGNDTFAEILKTVNEIAEDKVDIPASAKVGQVLSVKATDESGKPTEFEATDQGGGVSDEKIAEAVGTYMEAHPIEETDPTVPGWAKQPEKPRYTAEEVGADASGTAVAKVSEHNTASNAHNDIRMLVQGLTERLNALADSDDTTLDQMSEVVAYIKSNKSLIDAITTSKVNVSDIIDNLTTNVSNKPLSAAQGVKLKALIDAITTVELDESLTDNTKAAPAGMVGEIKKEVYELKKSGGVGSETGLSTEAIDKLEEVGNYLAYTTADGGSKWTELISILRNGSSSGGSGETEVTLSSISATYTGGDVPEGTALTDLIGVTVAAHYSDDSTENVTDYSLSGTIAVGTNTITVYYNGVSTTFEVVGIESTSSGVYGTSLAWGSADYDKWSENGNWFHTHYNESTASIQVGNGFSTNGFYSKPIDGMKYKYFRIPTAQADKQYAVSNNVAFYGCDSPNALTESDHAVTKCTKNLQFIEADFDSSSDSEGFAIIHPSETYAYYYISFNATNSLTSSYPDLLGVFDAGILDNPLAEATE